MAGSIVRLAQRERVFIPIRANVDQLVPVITTGALEEASGLVNLGVDGGEHDFQPTVSAFPHGALPWVKANHSAAMDRLARRKNE